MDNGAFAALGAEFDKAFPGAVIEVKDRDIGGKQAIVRFDHGWGLSIIEGPGSYGVEAALIHWMDGEYRIDNFQLRSNSYIEGSDDMFGYLTVETLAELLFKVGNLGKN